MPANFNLKSIMNPFFSKQFEVGSQFIDKNFRIRLFQLLGFMQEVAEQHSDLHHIAWKDLQQKNCFWTLYRMGLQFEQMPRWHDTITITTWANPSENLIQPREFKITNETGQVLVRAMTLWTILDTVQFRPQKIEQVINEDYPTHPQDASSLTINLKLPKCDLATLEPQCSRNVLYSDIDTNNHVNNTRYIAWLIDSYPIDYLDTHHLKSMIINYTTQAHIGDPYSIFTKYIAPNTHSSAIVRETTQEEFCKIRTEWEDKKKA